MSLIDRLREDEWGPYSTLRREAANRIEELEADVAFWRKNCEELFLRCTKLNERLRPGHKVEEEN